MVEDVTTDGRRIAELLASELTGLEVGPLDAVSVVDANPDVEPTAEGSLAYRLEYADERLGDVLVRPEAAVIVCGNAWMDDAVEGARGLSVESDGAALVVQHGAAVKRALDVLSDSLDA